MSELSNLDSEKKSGIMKLYTCLGGNQVGNRPGPPDFFSLKDAIDGQVVGCNNWVYGILGSPGVITQNSNGCFNVYGLQSREYCAFDMYDNGWFYGNFRSPKVLYRGLSRLGLVGESVHSNDVIPGKVINGCFISIGTIPSKERTHDWSIVVTPDYDLHTDYPEKFDPVLVKGLEQTLGKFLSEEGVSERVKSVIYPETLKMLGSPFHHGFWTSDNPHPRFGSYFFDF